MINSAKNGIFCDLCRKECKDVFVYYSVNFKEVDCDKNRTNAIVENKMDLDICQECFNEMKNKVLENIKLINIIKDNKNAKK
jgi:hypothetical protein